MTKRSQMEIMGLAVIIVLIVFGLMFYFKFTMGKKQTQYHKEYTSSVFASNMAHALLGTSTECRGQSFSGLYGSCKDYPDSSDNRCEVVVRSVSDEHICNYAYYHTHKILEGTLGSIGIKYHFVINYRDDDGDEVVAGLPVPVQLDDETDPNHNKGEFTINEPCGGEKTSSSQSITTRSGTIYVVLDICK